MGVGVNVEVCASAILLRKRRARAVQDLGSDGRIFDRQARDGFAEERQPLVQLVELGAQREELGGLACGRHRRDHGLQAIEQRLKGVYRQEKVDAGSTDLTKVLLGESLELSHSRKIDRAHLLQRDQRAALPLQRREPAEIGVHAAQLSESQPLEQRGLLFVARTREEFFAALEKARAATPRLASTDPKGLIARLTEIVDGLATRGDKR